MSRKLQNMIIVGWVIFIIGTFNMSTLYTTTVGNAAPIVAAISTPTTTVGPAVYPEPGDLPPLPKGQFPQRMPSVTGEVQTINGSTITVLNKIEQSTSTIEVTKNTQIFKQEQVALANIAVGKTIIAMGTQNGNVFTAERVHVGMASNIALLGGKISTVPNPNNKVLNIKIPGLNIFRGNSGLSQPNLPVLNHLLGSVEQVSYDAITVKTADGSTVKLQLASNGQIIQRVEGTTASIAVGMSILAMGERNDTTITATRIEILPPMPQLP